MTTEQEITNQVEELSPPPRERHRPYNLRVTDLRDQAWCEQQLVFGLTQGREETAQMRAGTERHEALHEEITEIIRVQPQTREDMWGLHLWNTFAGVQLLKQTGLGREIPVFGQIEGQWVVGIIDELQLSPEHTLHLLDTKTRRRNFLPRIEQKVTSRYQLACYKYLFDRITTRDATQDIFTPEDFFQGLQLSPDATFSDSMKEQMEPHGTLPPDLGSLMNQTLQACHSLPLIDPTLHIRYEWQQDHSLIGVDTFPYREDRVIQRSAFYLQYWRGEREPVGVPPREGWKCRYCEFQNQCILSPNKRRR